MTDIHVKTLADFGLSVKVSRKTLGLRQVDAARLVRVSPPVLNKLEQGKEILLSKAIMICNEMGIEIILRLPEKE